jgi:sugar lactone lactonase YvrE
MFQTLLTLLLFTTADEMVLQTIAGPSSHGDGGPAAEALIDGPSAIATAPNGDIYFVEANAGVIRRIRDGGVERFAGTGVRLDGPRNHAAIETDLITPAALYWSTTNEELYFADAGACRIRKIDRDGIVRDVAGSGRCAGGAAAGFGPPGGGLPRERLALETDLGSVTGMALDPDGRLVFTEEDLHQLRRIDSDGYIRVVAGQGRGAFGGDGSDASYSFLNAPAGLVFDTSGNLYIADSRNCRVRRIDTANVISTIAGTGVCASRAATFSGGAAYRAAIGRSAGIAYDAANNILYLASPQQSRLLRINLDTQGIASVLGNGTQGVADFTRGPNQFALTEPAGVAVAPDGSILVAALTSFQIYRLFDSQVSAFAGRWPDESTLLRPISTCTQPDGALLILDAGTERILRRNASGELALFAGAASPTGFTSGDNGPATGAQIGTPRRIHCASNGSVYLSQADRIRVIDTEGIIRTARERIDEPVGVLLDDAGRLIYSDASAHKVYRYDFGSRTLTTLAGTGTANFSGDGGAATSATLSSPGDLAFDPSGRLLIADRANRRVRRLDFASGRIETVIGSLREYSYIDITGEVAANVGLDPIRGIAVDHQGVVYVAESTRLIAVDPAGRVSVLLGFAGEDDLGVRTQRIRAVNDLAGLNASGDGLLVAVANEGSVIRATLP